ncbi:RNA polymerase sigma factor [Ferrimicrobium acidiphilum]|uniref:ECF RNA polymerase sigma-E factor n=1 Tax=Ferrimicrobium acidiphilum DSM 19497 TaxID=1121877 RepID=A0A0D8FUY1_9ACTN|nr:sigma-70 family RNA polymerase sigma factor [Ferrimicrobium acidiphilum]KJE76739.1 ECF RNA polymerase sigma-E factor [Ferrimicrobium acidiphilum DSM 19497]
MLEERKGRFDALYRSTRAKILAYALRRVPSTEDAADVLAETFTIAWRRLDQVPEGDGALLWLYGVARNVIRNDLRSRQRRSQLMGRIARHVPEAKWSVVARDEERLVALACLQGLHEDDQEVLMLTAWEGLAPVAVAKVLACSPGAARARIHRARRRLDQAILAANTDAGNRHTAATRGPEPSRADVFTNDPKGDKA